MTRLIHRLQRLEQARCVGIANQPCPECGRLPNGRAPGDGSVRFACSMDGYDPEPEGPEFCTSCGGRLIFRITFDDRG